MKRMIQKCRRIGALFASAVLMAAPLSAYAESLFPGSSNNYLDSAMTLDGKWSYSDYGDGRLSVICMDETSTHIEIPATINGKEVTMVEMDCFKDNTVIESVVIPDTVTYIEDWAFSGCTSLKSVTLPESLERIDWQAFYGCSALEKIDIPASVTLIEEFVFEGCSSMKTVNVSDANENYTSIDGVLFDAAKSTLIYYPSAKADASYDVPDGCTRIEDWAFVGNTYIESIDLTGVTEIGTDAFYYCTSLKSVAVPEGVSVLEENTFVSCSSLETVTLPSTLDEIGEFCFWNCIALREITIPGRVDTIGAHAFLNCPSLLSVALNDAVKNIGEYAFGFCVEAETEKYIRTPDFIIETDKDTAAHQYCIEYDIKSTAGVTQSSVFIGVLIVVIVLLIAVIVVILLVQRNIQKQYEYR